MKINLKRLVNKKGMSFIIRDIINSVGGHIVIKDLKGHVLIGNEIESSQKKYPIELEYEPIGWVIGGEKASFIATLLSYLATTEYEKKALARDTLEKYKEITFLYDIANRISSCLELNKVAELVINEARKFIVASNASVMLLNDDMGVLEIILAFGNEYDPKTIMKPGEGIAGSVMLTGRAEIVNDVNSDPRYVQGENKLSSLICAPLKTQDRVIGVINISSEEPVDYTAADLKLFTALASQAGVAIENARLYTILKETFFATVHTLAETIEKRDPYTGGHTKRVMDYSLAIGRSLKLSEIEMTNLELAAILHDIGKIGVRDDVLLKNGRLTDEEFETIKMHTCYGAEILNHIEQMKDVIPGVKYHHEKYDGSGYPDGLKGKNLDIIPKIIAVADTFDAMTTDRPYRKGLSFHVAFEELKNNTGTQFDPVVVRAFLKVYQKGNLKEGDENGKNINRG